MASNDINFELYKIFYQVAESGSFSQAAANLFITQSAVSQSVKNLETKLGVALFQRKTRQLRLTQEGELLRFHVQQAYHLLKNAESKLADIQNLEYGTVRVGASDTVCKYLLLPFLRRFTAEYPKLKIQVINRTSPQITELLKQGKVDLAIVTMAESDDPQIATRFLMLVRDIFVAAPKFRDLAPGPIPLSRLVRLPLLLLEETSATRRNLTRFLAECGVQAVPEIELESVDLLVEFAKIGLGVAHVLSEAARSELEQGNLFEVKTVEELPARQLVIALNRNVPLAKAAGEFIARLEAEKSKEKTFPKEGF